MQVRLTGPAQEKAAVGKVDLKKELKNLYKPRRAMLPVPPAFGPLRPGDCHLESDSHL